MTNARANQVMQWVSEGVSPETIVQYYATEEINDDRKSVSKASTPVFTGTVREFGLKLIEEAKKVLAKKGG